MSSKINPEELTQLIPLLASISRLLSNKTELTDNQLSILLDANDLGGSQVYINEIRKWSQLLEKVKHSPDPDTCSAVIEGLQNRGLHEAEVNLAVSEVVNSLNKLVSDSKSYVSTENIDLGSIEKDHVAIGGFTILEGGPGKIYSRNSSVVISPTEFSSSPIAVRVEVKPQAAGVFFSDQLFIMFDNGNQATIQIVAEWIADPDQDNSQRQNNPLTSKAGEKENKKTIRFLDLQGGLRISEALEGFLEGCNKKETLFAPDSWINPRLNELKRLLTDPISEEEAQVLCQVVMKQQNIDTLVEWLRCKPMTWIQYKKRIEEKKAIEDHKRTIEWENEKKEKEVIRRQIEILASGPLSCVSGGDVLNALYTAWARCEFPPFYQLSGSGMGDMVLDSLREKFSGILISGLRLILPNSKLWNQQPASTLNIAWFNEFWLSVPVHERRKVFNRLWKEHILININIEWGVEPGDAEDEINCKEYALSQIHKGKLLELPERYYYEYSWTYSINELYGLDIQTSFLVENLHQPKSVIRDQRIVLEFRVGNPFIFEIPIWLGANLFAAEQYYYNLSEDKIVTLKVGYQTYSRYLTVNRSWAPGEYILNAEIWYGEKSDLKRSKRLGKQFQTNIKVI